MKSLFAILVVLSFSLFATACCQGPKGDQGIPGVSVTGAAGQDGTDGATGPQGQPGTPATNVTTGEFCASQGPTTYGHFPEYGVCIQAELYGVYWDGTNAFMAKLAPGEYRSTATGLACTFTIAANCQVNQ